MKMKLRNFRRDIYRYMSKTIEVKTSSHFERKPGSKNSARNLQAALSASTLHETNDLLTQMRVTWIKRVKVH